jgi:FAD/FMN-containing dehydrogenase
MNLLSELSALVGADYVSDAPELLEQYSRDTSFVTPRTPAILVRPADTAQVQAVIRYANQKSIPVTPRSSAVGFHGAGIPQQGGILLDLKRLNRILEIDPVDKKVKVEAGVTWSQLQPEMALQGVICCGPLLAHPLKSVLTSSLEREPIIIPKGEYADTLLTAEVVLPSGELLHTGAALGRGMASQKFPEGPIPTSTRLFQGAQGCFGILTSATLKAEWLPSVDKLYFIPCERVEDAAEAVYRIQRRMIGNECLILNRFDLSAILADKWPEDFNRLRGQMPPWTVVINLCGYHRHPEGKVAYEEEALHDIVRELGLSAQLTVGGVPGLGPRLLGMLRRPWPEAATWWKDRYKGARHEVFFYATLDRAAAFETAVREAAIKCGYAPSDIGIYLQPVERARACVCTFAFSNDPKNSSETAMVRAAFNAASQATYRLGGLFTLPYGDWADMVYSHATGYTSLMQTVKTAFDPNHILNPGKLCF